MKLPPLATGKFTAIVPAALSKAPSSDDALPHPVPELAVVR